MLDGKTLREVIKHIDNGLSYRQIAKIMPFSHVTIHKSIQELMKFYKLEDKESLLRLARQRGLLPPKLCPHCQGVI